MKRALVPQVAVWIVGVPLILLSLAVPLGAQSGEDFVPVTDAMLEDPAPGDWLHWRRTQDGWAYSPLDQIDRENVGELTLAWSRGLEEGSQQGTPLVYDGVMYYPNPSSVTQAIDAATGDLLWEYRRPIPKGIATYVGGLETVNRSIAIHGGLIIDTANDGYVYALDAVTGELAWETRIVDYETEPARHSTGPMIAAGRVISGRSCRPHRGPEACFIATSDPGWRRATTRNWSCFSSARRSPRRRRSSCSAATRSGTSTTTRPWLSRSRPARCAGTTST